MKTEQRDQRQGILVARSGPGSQARPFTSADWVRME